MKIASKIKLPVKIVNQKFASNLVTIKNILLHYDGHTIDVIFQKRKNKRSNRQNKYYWAVVIPIFQNCINDMWGELWSLEEVHEFLKTNCNYEELVNEETGEVIRKVKSTTDNSTTDQENFHTRCRLLAEQYFNTKIPLPNEEIEIEFD